MARPGALCQPGLSSTSGMIVSGPAAASRPKEGQHTLEVALADAGRETPEALAGGRRDDRSTATTTSSKFAPGSLPPASPPATLATWSVTKAPLALSQALAALGADFSRRTSSLLSAFT